MPKHKKKKDNIIYTSFYEDDVLFAEQIYNRDLSDVPYKFVVWNKSSDSIDILDSLELSEDRIIKPVESELIERGGLLLPSWRVTIPEKELDSKIYSFLHKWLDVRDIDYKFISWYSKLSWIYDRLTVVPYMRALGDYGTGKTRFVLTVGSICYKPLFLAGASSDAYIFRAIETFKGTLVINELERVQTDIRDQITNILNNGYEKGLGVGRVEGDKSRVLKNFDVFSPKIISSRKPFRDLALESRIITTKLKQTSRKDIPGVLDDAFWKEAQEIRNNLLGYRIHRIQNLIKGIPTNNEPLTQLGSRVNIEDDTWNRLEGRVRQTMIPLTYVVPKRDYDSFISYCVSYQDKVIKDRGLELEGILVKCMLRLHKQINVVSLKSLRKAMNDELGEESKYKVTAQKVGRLLNGLELETYREGKSNETCVKYNELTFEYLKNRFVIDDADLEPKTSGVEIDLSDPEEVEEAQKMGIL